MRFAICDDDIIQLKQTALYIEQHFGQDIILKQYSSAIVLLDELNKGQYQPDILILDIELGSCNGIDIAREINTILPCCQIIFLTSHLFYATRAYEAKHVYFVLKTEKEQRLYPAIQCAIESMENIDKDQLIIKSNASVITLPCSDLWYLERMQRKTYVYCKETHYETYQHPSTLIAGFEDRLIHCHKSYYVNPAWVSIMNISNFVLKDNKEIPISKAYKPKARIAFWKYIGEKK